MKAADINTQFIDPVCRMKVSADGPVTPFTLDSVTYHFCTASCRKAFVSDPEKYLTNKTPKRKGLWGRYLDRVNKATGGKPPCCH